MTRYQSAMFIKTVYLNGTFGIEEAEIGFEADEIEIEALIGSDYGIRIRWNDTVTLVPWSNITGAVERKSDY